MEYFTIDDYNTNMNLIEVAMRYYGIKEVDGVESNPLILEIIQKQYHWVTDDSKFAWCSVFHNHICDIAGVERSHKANARSFLEVGQPVDNPRIGDTVIFWRGSKSSWKGHVGLFIREDDTHIWTLGGNQNNSVNIRPYVKSRVLGYRRLSKVQE